MKKIISFFILLMFWGQIQVLLSAPVLAQSPPYGFEFVYSNIQLMGSQSKATNPSISSVVYVDTDRVFTIIETDRYDEKYGILQTAYLSIHDNNGDQLAFKLLDFGKMDSVTRGYDPFFCNNIEKLENGNYIISGLQYVNLYTDSYQFYPFFYIFDHNGDSVLYQAYTNNSFMYSLKNIDIAKSPTGELIALQKESVADEDSFIWAYLTPEDSFLVNYRENYLVLTKHYPDGRIKWTRQVPGALTLTSNVEALYGITVSPDAQYYIVPALKLWPQADSSKFWDPAIHIIDSSGVLLRTISLPRTPGTDSFKEIVRGHEEMEFHYNFESYATVRATVGPDGYIYYMMVERAAKYDLTGWKYYYLNNYIHYGKMDLEGNIIWSRLFDNNRPMRYNLSNSNIAMAPNGDIIMALDATLAPNQGDKNIKRGIIIKASSDDGSVKWWKTLRTFNVFEGHYLKSIMVNPINGKIGIAGSVSCYDPITAAEWNNADSQRRQIQGVMNVAWLVLMDSNGYRCAKDSLYGEIIPPDCRQSRLLVDPQLEIAAAITLYPNPTKDWITVAIQDLKENYPGEVRCEVNDMLGRKLQSHILTYDRTNLDFTPYAPGIFMVNIFHNGKLVFSGKVRKE